MASNKKWFKRAMRTLIYGERQLWGLIKERLTPEQVAYCENEFGLAENDNKTEPTVEPESSIEPLESTKENSNVSKAAKPKRRAKKTTIKPRATKKRATKTKEK